MCIYMVKLISLVGVYVSMKYGKYFVHGIHRTNNM